MHRDPGYLRYTHHIIVRNDGFRIRGLSDTLHPTMEPGAMYCLDAVSPHQVVTDNRLTSERPIYKLQIAIDSNEIMEPLAVLAACAPLLDQDPLASFPEKYGSRAPQSW